MSPAQGEGVSEMKKRKGRDQLGDPLAVEPLMSVRNFHEIHEVKTTFIASLRYYLPFHYVLSTVMV